MARRRHVDDNIGTEQRRGQPEHGAEEPAGEGVGRTTCAHDPGSGGDAEEPNHPDRVEAREHGETPQHTEEGRVADPGGAGLDAVAQLHGGVRRPRQEREREAALDDRADDPPPGWDEERQRADRRGDWRQADAAGGHNDARDRCPEVQAAEELRGDDEALARRLEDRRNGQQVHEPERVKAVGLVDSIGRERPLVHDVRGDVEVVVRVVGGPEERERRPERDPGCRVANHQHDRARRAPDERPVKRRRRARTLCGHRSRG